MSKLKMLRFEAATLHKRSEKLTQKLQRQGLCHIEKCADGRLFEDKKSELISLCEKNMLALLSAIDILSRYGVDTGGGLFSTRKKISSDDFDALQEKAQQYLSVAENICKLQKNIEDTQIEISRCKTQIDTLKAWQACDIPLSGVSTKKTHAFCGTFPAFFDRVTLGKLISENVPDISEYDFEIVQSDKKQTSVVFVCHNNVKEQLNSALRSLSFLPPAEKSDVCAQERIRHLEETVDSLEKSVDENRELIKQYKVSLTDLMLCHDYYSVKKDEYIAAACFGNSQKTVYFCGYVPQKYEKNVKSLVEKHGGAIVFSTPEDEEDVPVALSNSKFSEPVEGIVEMYALPGKDDIDPTSIMSFFYYFLFGMMLSDAGYGLIMTIGTWIILKKNMVEGNMKKTMRMYFYCGISTVFWGAMFGSWFGDIYRIVLTNFFGYETAPSIALWFEPIKDPITLLLFSFVVGICHLFLGLITFGVMQWRKGDRASAVFDTVPVILTVLGAAPLAGSILAPNIPGIVLEIAKYVAIAGVLLIVFTNSRSSKNILARLGGGLYGLYNIASGYLSDILSYSRLLALGLATGSIASVVNMMGAMPENLVLKGILLTVVFIVGHSLNMAINVLGAYVHTNRLQFVELFSKFYEGGGRAYSPLKTNTKYYRITEEKENDN